MNVVRSRAFRLKWIPNFILQVCMGIGIFSTLLFYWLVRQKGRISFENEETVEDLLQQSENVEQISNNFGGTRRNCSKDRGDVNVIATYVESSNKVSESSTKSLQNCETKNRMTIRHWFKQPQLYQVIFGHLSFLFRGSILGIFFHIIVFSNLINNVGNRLRTQIVWCGTSPLCQQCLNHCPI